MDGWDEFLAPYQQSVEELKIKLKGIRKDYQLNRKMCPEVSVFREQVTGKTGWPLTRLPSR